MKKITNAKEVYDLVDLLIEESRLRGRPEVGEQLENALHLGSSSLEMLGAIGMILTKEARLFGEIIEPQRVMAAQEFIQRCFIS